MSSKIISSIVNVNDIINEMILKSFEKGAGALVIFIGFVKGIVDNKKVQLLNYEAYEPYASKMIEEIENRYKNFNNVIDVKIFHRIGSLKPGEPTIYIFVTAIDRETAFKVCKEILEEIKHKVPIFKLEVRENGEYWVIGNGKRIKRK